MSKSLKWAIAAALVSGLWCNPAHAVNEAPSPSVPAIASPQIVSKQRSYRIPYELSPIDHILLRARVNGHGPFLFILDTGAPTVFLSPAAAKRSGVTVGKTSHVTLRSFHMEGGLRMQNITGAVQELAQLQGMNNINITGEHLDGVIGFTLLAQFRLHIDLSRSHLVFTPTGWQPHIQTLDSLPTSERSAIQSGADKSQKQMQDLAKMAGSLISPAQNVATNRRPFFGIQFEVGAHPAAVATVVTGAPAWNAGIRAGDQVIRVWYPGRSPIDVTNAIQAASALNLADSTKGVVLVVLRGSTRRKFTVVPDAGGF